jgi:hypothetical protein
MRHIPGPLLILWDGLTAHRSRLVKQFVVDQNGRIELERLPAYAPELNPVEFLWGSGSIMSFRTSPFDRLDNRAIMPVVLSRGVVVPPSSALSGNRRSSRSSLYSGSVNNI